MLIGVFSALCFVQPGASGCRSPVRRERRDLGVPQRAQRHGTLGLLFDYPPRFRATATPPLRIIYIGTVYYVFTTTFLTYLTFFHLIALGSLPIFSLSHG